jgi:hypothetical protein
MKDYVDAVANRFRCFTVSEFYTSQKCWQCGAQLLKTRGWSWRYWRCEHNGGSLVKDKHGKQRHSAEENKDVIAALSMARIGMMLLIDGSRPLEWCSDNALMHHQRAVLAAALARKRPKPPPRARDDDDNYNDDDDSDDDGGNEPAAKTRRTRASSAQAAATKPAITTAGRTRRRNRTKRANRRRKPPD